MNAPFKCDRCGGRPFINQYWYRNHLIEHDNEDQEDLDLEWEKQQAEKPK